jgi:hypothetical protein
VDRRFSHELLKVISRFGVEASLKAIGELSSGDAAQRAALANKFQQLEYEAKRAFEQYDVVDARNRLAAAELERRWNEKLEEIEVTRQQLSGLEGKKHSLSSEERSGDPFDGRELRRRLAQRSLRADAQEDDLSHGH